MTTNTSRANDRSNRRRPPVPSLRTSVTDAITEVVLQELADVGYGKLTMDGVARRARSSKPTLYRRWSSKQEMVLDALASASRPEVPADDAGDLRSHLLELARSLNRWISDPLMRRILPDITAEGLRSGALDRALTHHIAEPRRAAVRTMMARAAERGEIRADANLEFVLDLLPAPIYWRVCVLRRTVDDDYLQDVTDTVLRELT